MASHGGAGATVDLADLIDRRPIDRRTIAFLLVAMLAMVSDGYDLSAMGYVAPALAREWRLGPAAFVPAFSAAIVAMMIGGPLFGMLGDRYGRKRLILAGLLVIGLTTLLTVEVRSIRDLIALRFVTGLGLGGVIPNVGALVAEMMPQRVRGRMLVIATMGVPIGIALPGVAVAAWVPASAWRALILIGGVLPLIVAALAFVLLPESLKFLVARGSEDAAIRRALHRLRITLPVGATLRATGHADVAKASFGRLFAGDLRLVTPLLWVCQAANQMANFFALTWLPMLLQAGHAPSAHGGATASLFSLGGLLSGVVLLFVLDRLGVVPIMLLFLLGTPLVAGMALGDLPPGLHALIIAGAGMCVTGVQIGITALLSIFYPTAIRSAGTGWTQAAGRIGALAAPVVGGLLLGLGVPMARLPLAPAALMAIGTVACAALAWRCYRRFGGIHAAEFAHQPEVEPIAG